MAYGNDPKELETVIKAKMDKENSSENPTDTSLENIIKPLRQLNKNLNQNSSSNLFQTILAIKDDEIDVSFLILLNCIILITNKLTQMFRKLVIVPKSEFVFRYDYSFKTEFSFHSKNNSY